MELEEFKKKISGKDQQLLVTIKDPVTSKTINYSVSNNTTLWRAQSLFEKEPITIKWIRSFKKNSVFYDVGANIGIYSIFAGYVSDVKVYSFEPESNNYSALNRNIVLNQLTDKVVAYAFAFGDSRRASKFFLSSGIVGSSLHSIDKPESDRNQFSPHHI